MHSLCLFVYVTDAKSVHAGAKHAIKSQLDTYKHLDKHEHISCFLPLVWAGYQCRQLALVVLPPVSSSAPPDIVAGFHLLFGSLLLMSGVV